MSAQTGGPGRSGAEHGNGVAPATAAVNAWSAEYLDGEYARFRADPMSVPTDLRAFFQGFDLALSRTGGPATGGASPFQSSVDELINAYREQGHLCARIDPFGRERPRPVALTLEHHGLSAADLDRRAEIASMGGSRSATLREIIAHLEQTYCGSVALEFMHIRSETEREWYLTKYEQAGGVVALNAGEKLNVLEQLARGEAFEAFCQKRYSGEKRFSLEGGVSLIPLLDQAIETASETGVVEMVVGMAHRGRLNVLNNVLGKSYEQIFTEFEDNWEAGFADGGGDVKYHRGYSGERTLRSGRTMHLAMSSNPSHLESVNAVVLGRCRAKQRMRGDAKERRRVIPLLIHGDGALPGQGVVAETLNMSQLEGYSVGGAVHAVINNLIAFTTIPEDGRSTTYCTDVAKMIDAPIFHVSGEDPEACVAVARLAVEYRQAFKKDVFIDLVCYRKYGHNEQDDQSYTQPTLAELIRSRQSTLTLYTAKLLGEGVIDRAGADAIAARINEALDKAQAAAKKEPRDPTIDPGSKRWIGVTGTYSHDAVKTGVPRETLEELCAALGRVPGDFTVNPKLVKLLDERRGLLKSGRIAHADGELLAIGSLLIEGVPVRLSGQDSRRGTFTQRHAVLRDFRSGTPYIPLNNVREMGEWSTDREPGSKCKDGTTRQAQFCVWDSPLSEFSVMGFDYGYSLADPNMLVMWEAQFGDFCNGAQVMIDQYLAPGELKWERWSGLVLLLPHGYEGAGPEHSSARMERFLQLAGNDNLQVVYPSTAGQMFHLLRRQVKRPFRKPLIVMTPKSMLRVPTSTVEEFVGATAFRELIDDPTLERKSPAELRGITRVIFCCGKLYHELHERRSKLGRKDVAIVRVEQLYPFHAAMAEQILARYPKNAERLWVQEEPRNAGAYQFIADQFRTQFATELRYVGRETSATPAVGSKRAHKYQQEDILIEAVGALTAEDKGPKETGAGGLAEPAPRAGKPAVKETPTKR